MKIAYAQVVKIRGEVVMGVRYFNAECVLNGLAFDLQRFVRERQDKDIIIRRMETALKLVKGLNRWNQILWWDDHITSRNKRIIESWEEGEPQVVLVLTEETDSSSDKIEGVESE